MIKVQKRIVWEKDNIVVGELTFQENNKTKTKNYIELKKEVILIVPKDNKYIYLIKEYRPLLGKIVWRVPAGTIELNEDPKKAALRELIEETGLNAKKITLLDKYDYMGWTKFPIYIYNAEKLSKQKQQLDFYEKINLIRVSRKEAKRIALYEMAEPHHAFAVLKSLEYKKTK